MHSLSVRRVFLRTTLSLSLSCYPRIPLWSSRKTASIIFILVDAQALTLSLFLSSTIHHVGNPIRRFLRSVCVCVCMCVSVGHIHVRFASSPRKFYPWHPRLHLLSPSLRGYARAQVYAPLRLPCTRVGTHTLARGTALDRIYRLYLRRYALEENLSSSRFCFPPSSLFPFSASLFFFFFLRFHISFLPLGFTYSSFPPFSSFSSSLPPRARFTKGFQPFEGSNTSPRNVLNVKLWITRIYTRPLSLSFSSTCYLDGKGENIRWKI